MERDTSILIISSADNLETPFKSGSFPNYRCQNGITLLATLPPPARGPGDLTYDMCHTLTWFYASTRGRALLGAGPGTQKHLSHFVLVQLQVEMSTAVQAPILDTQFE